MTLINRFPSWRVKVDENFWSFANASSIARDALSLSPLNFDMVVTGYRLIIVPSGPRPVGRPCLVSLPLLFFSSLVPCLRVVEAFLFTGTVRAIFCRSSVGRTLAPRVEGHRFDSCRPFCFILAACAGLGLTLPSYTLILQSRVNQYIQWYQ